MHRPIIVQQIQSALHELIPDGKVILFGSEARGDARPDSDIDLLILIEGETVPVEQEKEIIGVLSDLTVQTGIIISSIILPRHKWENRDIKSPFYFTVMNEGIEL
ncbi:MAG: nucleotidyltransferase domain-containing protein [Sphingobacteriia bacterium]|nr:nucleotidyltransferase domain-containing protein [Sphingobacteriia bacterium]OJX83329.1 MAG: hypothetical protein BGP01_03240 [Paludibacter sp. 47-17]